LTKPVISTFNQLAPILIQEYESYLPTAFDESMSLLEKVNKVIQRLYEIGELTNSVVTQWNEAMEWVMNDGLTVAVVAKLDEMALNGVLANLINIDLLNLKANKADLDMVNKKIIYPEKYGAVGDGVTDDYTAIQTMYNSIDDNSIVVFSSGKVYLLGNGTEKKNEIRIENRKGIKTYGYGATLKQNPNNPATQTAIENTFEIYTSTGIEIHGLTIEGGNVTRTYVDSIQIIEKGNGIRIFASSDIIIKDCVLNHNLIDGILIVGAYNGRDCDNIKILNCVCDNNCRQGISICECTNVLIDGGIMKNTGWIGNVNPKAGIDIEPNGYTDEYITLYSPTGTGIDKIQRKHKNFIVRNVLFENNAGGDLLVQYYFPKNVLIENCKMNSLTFNQAEEVTITRNRFNMIQCWAENNNFVISNNIINEDNGALANLFNLEKVNNFLIENNNVKNASNITASLIKMTGTGLLKDSPRNVTFSNNTFPVLNYQTLVSTNAFVRLINGFDNIIFKGNTILGNAIPNMLSQLIYIHYINANTDCDKRLYFIDNIIDCKNDAFLQGNNAGVISLKRNEIRNCKYVAYVDRLTGTFGTYKDFIMINNRIYLNSLINMNSRAVHCDVSNYKLDIANNNFFNTASVTNIGAYSYFAFVQCSGYFVDNIIEDGGVVSSIFNHYTSIIRYFRNLVSTKGTNTFTATGGAIPIQNYKLDGTVA
jgi:hypothetical protein